MIRRATFAGGARSLAEIVMKDVKADWRKWTRGEKISVVFIGFAMSSMVPLLLLGQG
jgi:hypothetical protein